ncbi:MAG: beta strand repeat-containing protein, partial [Pirellula sp.]
FDLYRISTWDGEAFRVFVNDSQAISLNLHAPNSNLPASGTTGNVSWTASHVSTGGDFGHAQTIRFSVIVTTPGTSLKLGFGSDLNEDISNESYGIDNLKISVGSAVNVNLSTTTAQNTGGSATDTLQQFENLTGSAFNDTLTGDSGDNVLRGSGGADTLTGGAGNDTFNVDSGIDTITDLGNGSDILVVSSGATANATATAAWTATSSTSNAGTATITASGFNLNLSAATGANAWTLTNSGNSTGVTLTGSATADTITGGTGNDTLVGGAGNDLLTGGAGNDTFTVDSGSDFIVDLGNGADVINVSAGATANVTVVAAWTATAASSNSGAANLTAGGFNLDVSSVAGTGSWVLSNSGNATAVTLTGSANGDTIAGGNAADTLNGGDGNDAITGGAGNDTIDGGIGTDT